MDSILHVFVKIAEYNTGGEDTSESKPILKFPFFITISDHSKP